jgi:ABC-type oligopeptide transport system substrate-binding subunit
MRIKQVLAFLGAVAVSSLALAEPAAPVSVSADGSTVTVYGDASPVFRLKPGQAEDVTGAFRLEDGRVLRLTSYQNKVFMEVDGKRERLLPLSRTEFVASKSGARVALDEEAFAGNVKLTQFHAR